MEHRGLEYSVVQGIDPNQRWRWTVTLPDRLATGLAMNRSAAEAEAVRMINRVLAPKKVKLVPPGEEP